MGEWVSVALLPPSSSSSSSFSAPLRILKNLAMDVRQPGHHVVLAAAHPALRFPRGGRPGLSTPRCPTLAPWGRYVNDPA